MEVLFVKEVKEKKIYRDEVYVGKLIRTDYIIRYNGDTNSFLTKPGDLAAIYFISLRSILFVPNEKGYAFDLLYDSPNYPILNMTEDSVFECINKETFLIKDAYNLGPLLKYYNYDISLLFNQIQEVKNLFFAENFAKENCQLFGYQEVTSQECDLDATKIVDKVEINRYLESKSNYPLYRSFQKLNEGILPSELFMVLDQRRNKSLKEVLNERSIGLESYIDSFAPIKEEGLIRKLERW